MISEACARTVNRQLVNYAAMKKAHIKSKTGEVIADQHFWGLLVSVARKTMLCRGTDPIRDSFSVVAKLWIFG